MTHTKTSTNINNYINQITKENVLRDNFPSIVAKRFGFIHKLKISKPFTMKDKINLNEKLNDVNSFICKKCKHTQQYDIQEKDIFKDVKQLYYECEKCKDYTPVFRTNNQVLKLQKEKEKLFQNILITLNINSKQITQRLINQWQQLHVQSLRAIKSVSNFR